MTICELRAFDLDAILALYAGVGWTNYTDRPEMLKNAYKNSLLTLGAYDGDRLVGVIRTVGDGFSVVFIQDILVLPEYQRQGIGTRLLKTVMDHFSQVYQLELMTNDIPETVSFYRSVGLIKADEIQCCAFIRP